jgi:hypothetical protein
MVSVFRRNCVAAFSSTRFSISKQIPMAWVSCSSGTSSTVAGSGLSKGSAAASAASPEAISFL